MTEKLEQIKKFFSFKNSDGKYTSKSVLINIISLIFIFGWIIGIILIGIAMLSSENGFSHMRI